MAKIVNENYVELSGQIISEFVFHHEIYGKNFYTTNIAVKRLSNNIDIIPLIVSDEFIDKNHDYVGMHFHITGSLCSYNVMENGKSRTKIFVHAKSMNLINEKYINRGANNLITIDGFICKTPVYRETVLNKIKITDIIVAVNSATRSEYLPCICWGNNATLASNLKIGTHVKIHGRIQSREYEKVINETEKELRITYEISVSSLEVL